MKNNQTNRGKANRSKKTSRSQEIPEWLVISDSEQVKLIANDLRMSVLSEFAKEELTAKQVADRLGEPPTKLYRHVNALAKHGLIVPTREEQKRGTVQKFYRAAARRFRIDDTYFSQVDDDQSKFGLIFQLLNTVSSEIAVASENAEDDDTVSAVSSICSLSKSEVSKFGEKIFAAISPLLDENLLSSKKSSKKRALSNYRVSILFHPVGEKPTKKRRPKKR